MELSGGGESAEGPSSRGSAKVNFPPDVELERRPTGTFAGAAAAAFHRGRGRSMSAWSDISRSSIRFEERLPRDNILAEQWVKILNNCNGLSWKPKCRTYICSAHFSDHDKYVTKSGRHKIKEGAVTTKALFWTPKLLESDDSDKSGSLDNATRSLNPTVENVNIVSITSSRQEFQIHNKTNLPVTVPVPIPVPSTSAASNKFNVVYENNPELSETRSSDSIFDASINAKLRNDLQRKSKLVISRGRQIRALQNKNRRSQKKNALFKTIIKDLKNQNHISNSIHTLLSKNAFAAELYTSLLKNLNKNKKRPMYKYTAEFRKFCLTLSFYSPKAYNFVRNSFNNCLF